MFSINRSLFAHSLILRKKLKKKFVFCMNEMSVKKNCTDIVWMDMEMTGLDIKKDRILELSCIITDENLNIKSQIESIVINCPKTDLENMNDWCLKHHKESGLIDKCLNSKITVEESESMLFEFIKNNIPKRECPLAGNSIYMDRLFLNKWMPRVNEYLHYRIIDVSTIKECAYRWNNTIYERAPAKKCAHRTYDDIKDSIAEFQYYKQNFFNLKP